MKRAAPIMLVLAVGICLGASIGPHDYPYVSEELNMPCPHSNFEWALQANGIRQDGPIKLTECFDIVSLKPLPQPDRLLVEVRLQRRQGVTITERSKDWPYKADATNYRSAEVIRERFGGGSAFEDRKALGMLLYLDNQLLCVSGPQEYKVLSLNATPQQQQETIAEILGPLPVPPKTRAGK